MRKLATGIIAIMLALVGCASDVSNKPEAEDLAPVDGKADSFRNPTEHGDVPFGIDVNSALTDDEQFHSWNFTLSDEASIDLTVSSRDENLDTVMYLYRRDPGEERWGRYIRRNDDDGERLQSAIRDELGAGEYRFILKGYKTRHRGSFSVLAACSGDGCVRPDVPGGDVSIPAATGFTNGCIYRLEEAMSGEVYTRDAFSVSPRQRTGLDRDVLVAVAHYDDLSDWEEYAWEPDEFRFDVEVVRLEDGSVVTLSDGGDESTTDYAFDASGNLLAYYVHNQSPWTEYYCGQEGEETMSEPHEDCVNAWMNNGAYSDGDAFEGTETYDPELPNDEINDLMAAAIAHYEANKLDGDMVPIEIEYTQWEGHGGGQAAQLLLHGYGYSFVSYTVVTSYYGEPWVVFESDENDDEGMHMLCER